MTNQCTAQRTAARILDREAGGVIAWRVVRQFSRPVGIARAEPLVVAIDELPLVVDDVKAVMRFVVAGQPVRRPEDDPNAHLLSKLQCLPRAILKQFPIEMGVRFDIGVGIPGECALGKVDNVRPSLFGKANLMRDVLKIRADIGADRKLPSRDRDSHRSAS